MDSIFGIGLPELIIILILAGLIMGPQRIRKVALTLGRVTAQLQAVSRQFARQLNAELDSLDDESLRGAMQDMRELQKEVESLRQELSQVPKSLRGEGQGVIKEVEDAFRPTSADNGKEIEADSTQPESVQIEPGQTEPVQTERNQPKSPALEDTEPDVPPSQSTSSKKPLLPNALDIPGDPE